MQFAHPGWFFLLVLVPVPWMLERARPRILWPSFAELPPGQRRRSGRLLLRFLPAILRGLALGALAVALARPQTVGGVIRIAGQGLAIVVALDQSSSMNTADFPVDQATRRISRLEAAKATFTSFVEGRPDDLIGLVVFANYPDLSCPPTLDHRFLVESVASKRCQEPKTAFFDQCARWRFLTPYLARRRWPRCVRRHRRRRPGRGLPDHQHPREKPDQEYDPHPLRRAFRPLGGPGTGAALDRPPAGWRTAEQAALTVLRWTVSCPELGWRRHGGPFAWRKGPPTLRGCQKEGVLLPSSSIDRAVCSIVVDEPHN